MKNSTYFPFERNKYFYGKLLSVEDFEREQRYMNDKRRMLNRFLHGTGVAAGLYVVQMDEQTISVEMGFALDSRGREIVVDTPVISKLSMIDGFDACCREDTGYLYLCLEYDETEADPVHNISGTMSAAKEPGDLSFGKIKEGYRLFLTDQEPGQFILSASDLYQEAKTVWQSEEIKITQIVPRYIQAGSFDELVVRVENLGRRNLAFSYDLVLNSLLSGGQARLHVSFDEMLFERTGSYEVRYPLQASEIPEIDGTLELVPESVHVSLSGNAEEACFACHSAARIVGGDVKEALIANYYKTAMERIAKDGAGYPVYLAKVFFVKTADTYIIDKIENVPFEQYIWNNVLESAVGQLMRKESADAGAGRETGQTINHGGRGEKRNGVQIAQGSAVIALEAGQRGDKFFSDEIVHGLGLGNVTILLGLEKKDGCVVFGSSEIFEQEERPGVDAELAACQNPGNGSFIIGLRLLSAAVGAQVKVYWTAVRDMAELVQEKSGRRIFIKPNLLELQVRQSYCLEAICENMVEKAVQWSVKDEGGFIDAKGLYTAPNLPGVYEIVAQSVAFPEVKASIFVIVREA